jgi:hypothetical protein
MPAVGHSQPTPGQLGGVCRIELSVDSTLVLAAVLAGALGQLHPQAQMAPLHTEVQS